jgi:hypothetical protein
MTTMNNHRQQHATTRTNKDVNTRVHVAHDGTTGQQSHTTTQSALQKYPLQFLRNFANAVLDNETGDLLEYWHLIKHSKYRDTWSKSFETEIQCLATTTQMILFVDQKEISHDRQHSKTYGGIVYNYREQKKDAYCTRITMGGNLINYPGNCRTPMAHLLTVKLLFNSVISTPQAKFTCIDIKDFYLCTPMS